MGMEQKMRDMYLKSCLNEETKPIFDIIGEAMLEKVVNECGGKQPYILKKETFRKYCRDLDIYEKFMNGKKVKDLARYYRISESEIRKIIKKVDRVLKGEN